MSRASSIVAGVKGHVVFSSRQLLTRSRAAIAASIDAGRLLVAVVNLRRHSRWLLYDSRSILGARWEVRSFVLATTHILLFVHSNHVDRRFVSFPFMRRYCPGYALTYQLNKILYSVCFITNVTDGEVGQMG